jgi:tetrahydromethanopterin S-methyltransferase subunit G
MEDLNDRIEKIVGAGLDKATRRGFDIGWKAGMRAGLVIGFVVSTVVYLVVSP